VVALSGPTTEEQEQEDGQVDSDIDNEYLGTTISTMFNETTVEQQQSISNATNPPIFTTHQS
jgi:hypothetical protein